MIVTQKKIQINKVFMIVTIVLGFSLITAFLILFNINNIEKSVDEFDYFVRNKMNNIVRDEVLNRIDEIEYDLSMINEQQKKITKDKISNINKILLNSELVDITDAEEQKVEVIKEFKKIANVDEDYLYFAINSEGVLLSSETNESSEGKNIIDDKDKDGVYYTQEALKAIEEPEGIYITYSWPKETGGEAFRKTSYCLYIPQFDIIIGTGSYEEDVEEQLKETTYSRIQEYYEDEENYIFIIGYDGIAHAFPDHSLIGKDITRIYDTSGRSIYDIFMEKVRTDKEGYVSYHYYKKNSEQKSEKISYAIGLDSWQAYIGMGYHVDDLNVELDNYAKDFRNDFYRQLIFITILMFCALIVVLFFVKKSLLLHSRYLQQKEVVFEQLFQLSSEGILVVSNKGKILYKNPIVNKIFGKNLSKYIEEKGSLHLNKIDEEVYLIEKPSGRVHYIKLDKQNTVYQEIDSYIYFISDMTSQYLKSNELERMALYDELTELPNRRKLQDDFEDLMENYTNETLSVIAIIDLDHFKKVNDEYGHNVGDEVLKLLGQCFKDRLRKSDQIYRFGGEEFIVLLKDIDIKEAKTLLEKICENFSVLNQEKLHFPITFSGGATEIKSNLGTKTSLKKLLHEADMLLYKAKDNGRARIEIDL